MLLYIVKASISEGTGAGVLPPLFAMSKRRTLEGEML